MLIFVALVVFLLLFFFLGFNQSFSTLVVRNVEDCRYTPRILISIKKKSKKKVYFWILLNYKSRFGHLGREFAN